MDSEMVKIERTRAIPIDFDELLASFSSIKVFSVIVKFDILVNRLSLVEIASC